MLQPNLSSLYIHQDSDQIYTQLHLHLVTSQFVQSFKTLLLVEIIHNARNFTDFRPRYHFQHGLVNNIKSQVNEVWESESPLSSIFNIGCSEVAENSFIDFSVDELSKVTADVEQTRSSRKRKFELNEVEVNSQKQSVECDSELVKIIHNARNFTDFRPRYHFQHSLVNNIKSQVNEVWESESPLSSIFNFGCSEVAENSFMDFSVDQLSKVTADVEQTQSSRKRKFELNEVEVNSQKQSVECDSELVEPPKAERKTCNGDSKPKVDSKTDYIHVRACRGQATDSHSIAERAKREKIKRKMQFLQDLIPGCSNITNKAAILDEIISYVQCLHMEALSSHAI